MNLRLFMCRLLPSRLGQQSQTVSILKLKNRTAMQNKRVILRALAYCGKFRRGDEKFVDSAYWVPVVRRLTPNALPKLEE